MRQPPICCREIKPKKPGGAKRWVVYYAKHDYERYRVTVDRCDREYIEEKLMEAHPWRKVERAVELQRKLNGEDTDTALAEGLAPVKKEMDAQRKRMVSRIAVYAAVGIFFAGFGYWFTFVNAVNADQAPPQPSSAIKRSVK